jgi:hypothetical protein
MWIYISTPPSAFMKQCLIRQAQGQHYRFTLLTLGIFQYICTKNIFGEDYLLGYNSLLFEDTAYTLVLLSSLRLNLPIDLFVLRSQT